MYWDTGVSPWYRFARASANDSLKVELELRRHHDPVPELRRPLDLALEDPPRADLDRLPSSV